MIVASARSQLNQHEKAAVSGGLSFLGYFSLYREWSSPWNREVLRRFRERL